MLTPEQQLVLRDYIANDQTLSAFPMNGDGAYAIAAIINQTAAPEYIVWRTSVSQDEIMQNGFDWTRVDNLGVGPARVWEWMFDNASATINPSKLNVRAGIEAVWKGTTADLAVRAAVYAHCKRPATVIEKLFSTGSGTDASPSTMGTPDGPISYSEVEAARNL